MLHLLGFLAEVINFSIVKPIENIFIWTDANFFKEEKLFNSFIA